MEPDTNPVNALMTDMAAHPGEAFRWIASGALIGAAAVVALHFVLCLIARRPAQPKARWTRWETLVYLGTIAAVCVLAATAFGTVLRHGALEGWWLMAHMAGAGAFVVVLPVLALSWCEANRFGRHRSRGADERTPRFFWFPKLMFWLFVASGLAVIVTMLLSMVPLFGSDGMHRLLEIHRYSGLVAVIALVLHLYTVLLQRLGLR